MLFGLISVSSPNPATYILGSSLGGRQDMYTERLVDSVVVRARDVMTSSYVVRGDSRLCQEVTRERQSMFLRRADVLSMSE